jgi:hypothetical protein
VKRIDYYVYIDSDGVIADFDGKVKTAFGKSVDEFENKKELWSSITQYDANVEKFFLTMDKLHDADELIKFCRNNFATVIILTASGYTPKDAAQQKIKFYETHYPGMDCCVVRKSGDKAAYAHKRSILIDDRSKSIDPWIEAGGIGILHTDTKSTIAKLKEILG